MALYPLLRPLIFALDAERAHRLTIAALKLIPARRPPAWPETLRVRVAGLDFPNPVGLAAGFDKDAEVFDQMPALGFGFVEIGTLTPLPQQGNPRPRLFRLAEDRAVINRMGFNNLGQHAAKQRLARRRRGGIVGVNLGANKDSRDRIADYEAGAAAMAGVADYLTINVSSPNTPGLRALQGPATLDALIERTLAARGGSTEPGEARPPVFLKVAPDLEPAEIDAIARIVIERGIDALIVGNTTVGRPPLRSRYAGESGGLSGRPITDLALSRLRHFRAATGDAIPLIAVGGIGSAEDAWARIRAGASLVQLYTALAYEGPGVARRIVKGLDAIRARAGFASIAEAIGVGRG